MARDAPISEFSVGFRLSDVETDEVTKISSAMTAFDLA